jgi:hypothetical protein
MSDVLDLEQRPSRPLWLFAGVAALALVADEGLNFTLPVIFKVKSKS